MARYEASIHVDTEGDSVGWWIGVNHPVHEGPWPSEVPINALREVDPNLVIKSEKDFNIGSGQGLAAIALVWVGGAVTAGVVGNAAYDLLKAGLRRLHGRPPSGSSSTLPEDQLISYIRTGGWWDTEPDMGLSAEDLEHIELTLEAEGRVTFRLGEEFRGEIGIADDGSISYEVYQRIWRGRRDPPELGA